jgi:hypothetical protein
MTRGQYVTLKKDYADIVGEIEALAKTAFDAANLLSSYRSVTAEKPRRQDIELAARNLSRAGGLAEQAAEMEAEIRRLRPLAGID